MLMEAPIYDLRAHHGLCLSFFIGQGYSGEFVENMAHTKAELDKNPLVHIVDHADVICKHCPNHIGGACSSLEKVCRYDSQVLKLCGVVPGAVMPYLDFVGLVQKRILLLRKRKEVCPDCQWNDLCNG